MAFQYQIWTNNHLKVSEKGASEALFTFQASSVGFIFICSVFWKETSNNLSLHNALFCFPNGVENNFFVYGLLSGLVAQKRVHREVL